MINTPREVDFNLGTPAVFRDMETGAEITTQPNQIRHSYHTAVEDFCQTLKRGCYMQNIDYMRVTTDMPFDVALREYLVKRNSIKG
ncbi:MAG: hypothetical protein NTX15_05795 [Candidatus Kapabacteria bacterium]|nr:hypothetical protein [Candidatus Kapabacteria bacterium]